MTRYLCMVVFQLLISKVAAPGGSQWKPQVLPERNVSIGLRHLPFEFSVALSRWFGRLVVLRGPAPGPPGFFEAWLGCSKGVVVRRWNQ